MSPINAQRPAAASEEQPKSGNAQSPAVNACQYCNTHSFSQKDSGRASGEGLTQSADASNDTAKKALPPPPSIEDAGSDNNRVVTDLDSETKESDPETIQEAKITRVSFEKWRQIKKDRKIDPEQSVLLVSSKANAKPYVRKKPRSDPEASATEDNIADPVTKESRELGVPYRLAINSHYLLGAVAQCTGAEITEACNVFIRPFKYLVWYEAEIRQFFTDLELAYDQARRKARTEREHDSLEGGFRDEKSAVAVSDDKESVQKTETAASVADRAKRERDEFGCLLEFMDRDMAEIFEIKRQISDKSLKEVAFEHLWLLFRPGNITYRANVEGDANRRQAYRILHVIGGRVSLDTGKKFFDHAIMGREWDFDSESEERMFDTVKSSDREITSLIIDCCFIDCDGLRIGPRPKRFSIQRYNGTRPVTSLPLYPCFLHPDNAGISKTLIARGRQFIELAAGVHKKYEGRTIRVSNQTTRHTENSFVIPEAEVHSEVIVDQGTGVEHFRSKLNKRVVRLGGGILLSPTQMDYREVFDPWPGKQNEDWATDVFDDSRFESDHRSKFVHNTELLNFQPLGRHPISDEYLKLLPPRLFGYSLLDHKWLALDITRVCELPPRSLAANFRDLVLPDGHAMLLQALIKDHIQLPKQGAEKSNEIADGFGMDVVAGKGKGLIILLHGVPGVGKTSTAECLAAELKRPLLPITCGDIGTTAKEAEETLSSFCELAHRWRCVLLLDEADVFLAKREKGDIHRNSLVSVFLRVLEYYSGVIILTTNRVGEFDEAFRSRIHISLYYPKLDELSTKEIWEKNLSRLKSSGLDIDIEEAKIRRFVDWHWEQNRHRPTRRWNGRQIKNAFQTALALAKWDFDDPRTRGELKRPLLRAKHFKRVSETSAHFDDYIRDVHGIQEEDDAYGILAGRDELRQDSNPGFFKPGPQEISRPGKRLPVRRGTNSYGAAAAQSRAYEFDDDDVSEEDADDVQRLELELKLAKLKKKKTPKAPAARSVVDEDDESW